MAARALVTRIPISGKLVFTVDVSLAADWATVLAPANRRSIGVRVCPRHKPPCVKKEFLRRSEDVNGFRSWQGREDRLEDQGNGYEWIAVPKR